MTAAKNTEYEERIIVFIDLLGFRELVKRLSLKGGKRLFQRLKKALSQFSRESMFYNDKFWSKDELKAKNLGKEISNFSDTIVISYSTTIPSEFNEFLPEKFDLRSGIILSIVMDLMGLYVYLTPLNLAIRGAITIGNLYHTDDVIFGDALVSAYDLERKDAVYPRIIINEDVLKGTYIEAVLTDPETKENSLFFRRDTDQKLIFDHLLFSRYFGHGSAMFHLNRRNFKRLNYEKYVSEIRKLIISMAEATKSDARIKAKADWYIAYFNNHIESSSFNDFEKIPNPDEQ